MGLFFICDICCGRGNSCHAMWSRFRHIMQTSLYTITSYITFTSHSHHVTTHDMCMCHVLDVMPMRDDVFGDDVVCMLLAALVCSSLLWWIPFSRLKCYLHKLVGWWMIFVKPRLEYYGYWVIYCFGTWWLVHGRAHGDTCLVMELPTGSHYSCQMNHMVFVHVRPVISTTAVGDFFITVAILLWVSFNIYRVIWNFKNDQKGFALVKR